MGPVSSSVSERSRLGLRRASSCAIAPPIECPTRWNALEPEVGDQRLEIVRHAIDRVRRPLGRRLRATVAAMVHDEHPMCRREGSHLVAPVARVSGVAVDEHQRLAPTPRAARSGSRPRRESRWACARRVALRPARRCARRATRPTPRQRTARARDPRPPRAHGRRPDGEDDLHRDQRRDEHPSASALAARHPTRSQPQPGARDQQQQLEREREGGEVPEREPVLRRSAPQEQIGPVHDPIEQPVRRHRGADDERRAATPAARRRPLPRRARPRRARRPDCACRACRRDREDSRADSDRRADARSRASTHTAHSTSTSCTAIARIQSGSRGSIAFARNAAL